MSARLSVVVPSYRLVWYNPDRLTAVLTNVVVPSYRLVWYNLKSQKKLQFVVVVPSYRLVWYNPFGAYLPVVLLLFPVIAWYGII